MTSSTNNKSLACEALDLNKISSFALNSVTKLINFYFFLQYFSAVSLNQFSYSAVLM